MNNKRGGLTIQQRLIIGGVALSTLIISVVAFLAVRHIQFNMDNAYKNFAQIISKTLAIESVEITRDIPEVDKYDTLRTHSISILKSNEDIAFIEFRDNTSKVIYSSKTDFPKKADLAAISVSSPMINKATETATVVGSVMVGLSGQIIKNVSNTTRASLLFVFIITWIVLASVVAFNITLITRELRKLQQGVKNITTGQFGYTIDESGSSKEVRELFEAFNDMSSKLHLYEEQNIDQLTLERNKLEAVLMSIANGVVVCDNFDNIVLVNEHAKTLLEVSENDILNTKIQSYCDTNGELCFKDKIEQFKDTPLDEMEKKPLNFNIEVDKQVIKSIISPMFSKNKEYVGYIIVLIDVTKEIEMDNLRSHFISNVSHELRTPVTVLRSYIDTLYNYGNDFDFATQKEFIGVINQEIVRLNRMVNDILDFSRYESTNIKLEKSMGDITQVIEDCVNQMQVLATEHSIVFSVIKEPDLPQIPFNRDSISRVLTNIISNAIKYSPDGSRIKVRAERSRVTGFVEVSVEDQGSGIAEEYQKKIFDRFFRIENDTHTIKGTGLGLHLVKISVEKHHQGQVFVNSKLGEGSTFGFRLPINAKFGISQEDEIQSVDEIESLENTQSEVVQKDENDGWEISLERR